jgi:hypothetical protein
MQHLPREDVLMAIANYGIALKRVESLYSSSADELWSNHLGPMRERLAKVRLAIFCDDDLMNLMHREIWNVVTLYISPTTVWDFIYDEEWRRPKLVCPPRAYSPDHMGPTAIQERKIFVPAKQNFGGGQRNRGKEKTVLGQ